VGYVFLIFAFGAAVGLALFAPRAGLVLGGLLLIAGLLPLIYLLFAQTFLGARGSQTDGMLVMLGLFFLSAPGFMLLACSLLFGWET
jgi:hypothetical protein